MYVCMYVYINTNIYMYVCVVCVCVCVCVCKLLIRSRYKELVWIYNSKFYHNLA